MRLAALLVLTTLATSCARRATVELAVGASMTALGAAALAAEPETPLGEHAADAGLWLLIPGILVTLAAATELIVVREDPEPPLTAIEQSGVLVLVNSPKETSDTLARGAGIAFPIASRIIVYRDGRDGIPRSADDNRFDALDELRAIPGITRPVVLRLLRRATELHYVR